MTFESLLDKFPEMSKELTSFVLVFLVGPSGGIIVFNSRVVVEVVSLFMMFVSTLTSRLLVSSTLNLIEASLHGKTDG